MTKKAFRRYIMVSSIVTVLVVALVAAFSVVMFQRYSPPGEHNTSVMIGTVKEAYFTAPKDEVVIEMSDGERLQLVYSGSRGELYSVIGYGIEDLADLLEGETVQYRRMNDLPWVVEIDADGVKIDNSELTMQQMTLARVAIVIVGTIILVLSIACDVTYLMDKYRSYRKAEKKAKKRQRRKGGDPDE